MRSCSPSLTKMLRADRCPLPVALFTISDSRPQSYLPIDVIVFPPPRTPFLDDDFNYGYFTFASTSTAPQPPMADPHLATLAVFDDDWGKFVVSPLVSNPDVSTPPTPPTIKSNACEKPWGPPPLSLFGADDEDEVGGGRVDQAAANLSQYTSGPFPSPPTDRSPWI